MNKNKAISIIVIVLVAVLLIVGIIFSVKAIINRFEDREYDEEEVIAAAKILIEKSEVLNEIYYGYGIGYEQDENLANGYYYPADVYYTNKFNINNIEDIKKLTRECYTEDASNSMISTTLESTKDQAGNIVKYARYYQKYNAIDNSEECIMVYSKAKYFLVDKVVYDYNSIRVSGVEKEEVFVTITVTVTTSDGKTQTKDIEIALLEESNGWRLNSPTYARYVDRDHYNDLQNK